MNLLVISFHLNFHTPELNSWSFSITDGLTLEVKWLIPNGFNRLDLESSQYVVLQTFQGIRALSILRIKLTKISRAKSTRAVSIWPCIRIFTEFCAPDKLWRSFNFLSRERKTPIKVNITELWLNLISNERYWLLCFL